MAKKKKTNATRRLLIALGVLVALLIVFIGVGSATGLFGGGDEGVEVEVVEATRRDLTQVVTASGKVQPEMEVKITPDVSGEIIELRVKEGDRVQRGQLLARIKPDFYVAQLEQSQAGVLQSQANAAQRKADLLSAEVELKRQQELFNKKVIAESQLQAAQTQYEVAKAAYEAAQYAVQSAEARRRELRNELGKTSIFAPMSGTVSQLNVELGERVVGTSQMAGTEMLRIAELDQMEIEVDVNENDVINVALGDSAQIEVDAYPDRPFLGLVTEIANSARVSGMGTQEQITNFPVKIRVMSDAAGTPATGAPVQSEVPLPSGSGALFRPGMSGTVDIFTKTVTNAVAVPIQAVTVRDFNNLSGRRSGGEDDEAEGSARAEKEDLRKVVFIVDNGKARMVEVETGIADDTYIEITAGLAGGEQVIVGPFRAVSRTLRQDMAVQPKKPLVAQRGGPAAR